MGLTNRPCYGILLMLHEYMHAALAQSVERRLGKAEVGGSIPLGSFFRKFGRGAFQSLWLWRLFILLYGG